MTTLSGYFVIPEARARTNALKPSSYKVYHSYRLDPRGGHGVEIALTHKKRVTVHQRRKEQRWCFRYDPIIDVTKCDDSNRSVPPTLDQWARKVSCEQLRNIHGQRSSRSICDTYTLSCMTKAIWGPVRQMQELRCTAPCRTITRLVHPRRFDHPVCFYIIWNAIFGPRLYLRIRVQKASTSFRS